MKLVGRRFKTTAIKFEQYDAFRFFGINPRFRHMYGVKKEEPIYELEFEVVDEYAKYPKDPRALEYWCLARIEDMDYDSYPTKYIPREEPGFELVGCPALLFSAQFGQPVFDYQHKSGFGVVCKLKLINTKKL